jgi:hypothetical protein
MNDFTKEELENILNACMDVQYNLNTLEDKIRSMIENYCEHEWQSTTTPNTGAYIQCVNCHAKPQLTR